MSFDTRSKILTLDQLRNMVNGQDSIAFVTHLEVLQASHVRRLEEVAAARTGKVFVILTDPEAPLVPLESRAQLTAALRVVDYVVPSPEGAGPALAVLNPGLTIHDEQEDRGRTRKLVEHVRSRARN